MMVLLLVPRAGAQPAPTTVTIQLKWTHQFQFAGYYQAVAQGYFRDAGLEVTLRPGQPDLDPVATVLRGQADFGVSNASLVLDRMRGDPVVAVATIFQHSPFTVLARPDVLSIHDLAGRRVMVEAGASELLAFLASEHVPVSSFIALPHSGNPLVLGDGKIDAMTAYTTTEPYLLRQAGVSYREFDPKASGIDFYGDTLFTTEALARRDPGRVRRLRDAVLKGWAYALAHPEETVDLIRRDYAPQIPRDRLLFEAEVIRKLAVPEVVEIGYMNPRRWKAIAQTFVDVGLARGPVDLDGFLFEIGDAEASWVVYALLAAASVVAGVAVAVAGKFRQLNRNLNTEIAQRMELEEELRYQAGTDFLTGLANRRRFLEMGDQELRKAQRFQTPLAVLMIDIDHFKAVNDTYGHQTGDRVICAIADICRAQLREVDLIGRMGGEEYVVMLPHTDLAGGVEVAERIRRAVASAVVCSEEEDCRVVCACSIGVATHRGEETLDRFLQRADAALYRAKRDGRNCVRTQEESPATA